MYVPCGDHDKTTSGLRSAVVAKVEDSPADRVSEIVQRSNDGCEKVHVSFEEQPEGFFHGDNAGMNHLD